MSVAATGGASDASVAAAPVKTYRARTATTTSAVALAQGITLAKAPRPAAVAARPADAALGVSCFLAACAAASSAGSLCAAPSGASLGAAFGCAPPGFLPGARLPDLRLPDLLKRTSTWGAGDLVGARPGRVRFYPDRAVVTVRAPLHRSAPVQRPPGGMLTLHGRRPARRAP